MEAFLTGLDSLMQPAVLVAILIGSVGGLMIGAVPGIGPAIAIAILLPATVFLDDLVSLVLLLGVYGSSMYGGAIPAILINTPGTPVNALTTYDGYAMTRRGEPGRALSLAYSASFFGGCFSIIMALIALFVFGPYLRDLGALFGQRDIMMAAILGGVLLIAAHRQTMGIAAMLFGFGFLIAMIGRQSTRRIDRFTFDIEYLYSGFNLIVVIVGIFALSQALNLMVGKDDDPPEARITGGLLSGFRELAGKKLIAICSACYGTIMGIIPGVGEFVAQFFSYSTARSLSKDPARFGHGSSDGLVASETSNNAVPAAAMIPLLALGIPGEALTAMMLSVFYVHNVVPGPGLFQNQLDFVVALYLALLILNILVVIFLLFSTNLLLKVIEIPTRFLGIAVLTLSFVGVYSLRNSTIDCAIAGGFGILGFILKRQNLPIVPIILGMVLGGIMEAKLRTSMMRVKTPLDFIDRPIAFILFLIIVAVIASHVWSLWREWSTNRSNRT